MQVQPNDLARASPPWCGWETPGWVVPSWFHPLPCPVGPITGCRKATMGCAARADDACHSKDQENRECVQTGLGLWAAAGIARKNCLENTSCAMKWLVQVKPPCLETAESWEGKVVYSTLKKKMKSRLLPCLEVWKAEMEKDGSFHGWKECNAASCSRIKGLTKVKAIDNCTFPVAAHLLRLPKGQIENVIIFPA